MSFLYLSCTKSADPDKINFILHRRSLEEFTDFDKALERLKDISNKTDNSPETIDLVATLLQAAENGENYLKIMNLSQ